MKRPSEAAKLIHEFIDFTSKPERLSTLLARIIEKSNWAKGDAAIELAEKWLPNFKKSLERRILLELELSQIPCCEICPSSDDYIQGSCYVSKTCTKEEAEQRQTRANKKYYTEEFSTLSNDEFEVLCSRVLSLWRVERDFVTRRSADQGIDFYGLVPFGEILKPSAIGSGAEKQLKIWLVGQAKNYRASQVSTKDIRELVGSVNLARSKIYAGSIDPLSKLQMRACDPVFFLFFTTGKISKDAWGLLSKAGVVAMDGEQLAVFLADHSVGLLNGAYHRTSFRNWMLKVHARSEGD